MQLQNADNLLPVGGIWNWPIHSPNCIQYDLPTDGSLSLNPDGGRKHIFLLNLGNT